MASKGIRPLPEFNPSESASSWEDYKRDFIIHLDALGLDDKPGQRKVGVLLANMGRECVKIYDSFAWAPEVVANQDAGIAAVPAEDKYHLETVFTKFDRHFGVQNYRNIKRQEFLNTKRGNLSIMDYISELKRKAEHCQYGEQKEGLICDMIINGVNDTKCSEKLMEIPVTQLTIERVVQVCRQIELTASHIKSLGESPHVNIARTHQNPHKQQKYCAKCCRKHEVRKCPAYQKQCDNCGEFGHFKASKLCPAVGGTSHQQKGISHRGARGYGRINLLGRDDSVDFGLIMRIHTARLETESIIEKYSDVLGEEIGCIPGEYEIKIDKSIEPVVHAPRPVPVAIREQLQAELKHLEKCNIIAKVTEPTQWVSSLVCVRKKNGRVRICIDPTDLNRAIRREHYPMNSFDDVATRLNGSKYFTTLDANMGYYQIKLTEESSKLTAFNTPFGRYRYLRMPMGVKCSSEVFQRSMEQNFGNIDGVEIIVDDILIHGRTLEEHNRRLETVLQKARSINLKMNKKKCMFAKPEVDYVGHKLTGDGIKPTDQRVKAIADMREPESFSELETVLGMLSYVSKFIPNLSELNAPLRDMKRLETWSWGDEAKRAFNKIKEALVSTKVLQYYDLKKPVTLTVDASMRGLGAAIIQQDRVVAYASRALTPTEQRYAQIEKEMLAVVYGCEKFHKLLYGRDTFLVESDHKPLESILKKEIHKAPLRIQRMILKLQPYDFNLVHKSGKDMGLADCLSRLPLENHYEKTIDEELMVLKLDTLSCSNHDKIARATQADEQFQVLAKVIIRGWPETKCEVPVEAVPFWDYRDEISIYNGVLYRGERVCIPKEMRTETLKAIHKSHLGVVNCKKRARELVFWPGMNKQIEDLIGKCSACLMHRKMSQKEPMIIQPVPELPWSKVGMDLCELEGNNYLIIVDFFSNFIEVAPLQRDTRTSTILKHIKQNVARYGIMDSIISDNGPQFTSAEFREFIEKYGITHITSSPLHQQTNGLAEKAVQTVKNLIKKCSETGDDIYLALLELRNTPRDNIGSPMQRLMGRRAKTLIPMKQTLRQPEATNENVAPKLLEFREKQKFYYDQHAKSKDNLQPGDAVRIKTPSGWKPAEYVKPSEYPRSHIVKAGESGREYRRNTDMLMKTKERPHIITTNNDVYIPAPTAPTETVAEQPSTTPNHENSASARSSETRDKPGKESVQDTVRKKTRSGREVHKPIRLNDYV
ncbi:uncharacterized protein K02A2.6-like [Dreissena polymorpha]|uniref:uncharacterized protein K02A2.6-like n=1 Tax=Dreissena polymorpha TaxID=45954 RepID=UPI0022646487|nr:uncharacterized protein K02A2.6-like [Dreissena polymorpha]